MRRFFGSLCLLASGFAVSAGADVSGGGDPPPPYVDVTDRMPPAFRSVFRLRVTPSVLDSAAGGFDQAGLERFARDLVDVPGASGLQIFRRVWDYYAHAAEPAPAGTVRFRLGTREHDRIVFDLYDRKDIDCPDPRFRYECNCWGVYAGGNRFKVGLTCGPDGRPSPDAVLATFAHELQHLADKVNRGYRMSTPDSEMLSAFAEYTAGFRWVRGYDGFSPEYDVSLMGPHPDNFPCSPTETQCKYNQYRLLGAYLFRHFSGPRPADDLVYRWIRQREGEHCLTSFLGLGRTLMEPPYRDRVPGETEAEKVGTLYHRFALARYADDDGFEGGRYGFGPRVTARSFALFQWPDTNMARARVVPPRIPLVPGQGPDTLTAWRDPVQPWGTPHLPGGLEPFRVLTTGSDYLVFAAEGQARVAGPLRVRIESRSTVPPGQAVRVGLLAYRGSEDPLWERKLVRVEENLSPGGELPVEITVDDFGSRTRGVVVVISLVERELSPVFHARGLVQALDYRVVTSWERGRVPPHIRTRRFFPRVEWDLGAYP